MTEIRPLPTEREFSPRQCPRRRVHLQFDIGGLDFEGKFFEERVTTSDISDSGGCFCSRTPIKVGSILRLSGPRGFISLIQIVWFKERPDLRTQDVGFAFVNPFENGFRNGSA
jgi:hypothetical protein